MDLGVTIIILKKRREAKVTIFPCEDNDRYLNGFCFNPFLWEYVISASCKKLCLGHNLIFSCKYKLVHP